MKSSKCFRSSSSVSRNLAVLTVGVATLALAAPAQAEVKLSGHVAYNLVDRDSEEDLVFQRNGFSESRFRMILSKKLDNGLTVGMVEEVGIAEGEGGLDARRQEVIVKGGFGGIRFGQGNDAGDGNLNGELSGTSVIQPMASNATAYGYSSSNYNGFDPGRGERLRYDSPKLGGAVISAQIGENSETEIGLRYKTSFMEGDKFRLGAFVTNTDNDKDSSGVLLSYSLPMGLNFSIATASKDNAAGAGVDGKFNAVKIGYKTGKHAVSVISGTSENPKNAVETDSSGLAYVYTMDKGMEFYAAVQQFDSDNNAVDEDFTVVGARVKF